MNGKNGSEKLTLVQISQLNKFVRSVFVVVVKIHIVNGEISDHFMRNQYGERQKTIKN